MGTPRIGLLEEKIQVPYCSVNPFYFTHGDRLTNRDDRSIGLCTAYLVSRMQALLQTGRYKLPDTTEAHAAAEELLDYEIWVSEED